MIKHDICTEHCSKLKKTNAVLIFKIAEPSPLASTTGGYSIKRVECSLNDVKKFKEELVRMHEAM